MPALLLSPELEKAQRVITHCYESIKLNYNLMKCRELL